ncbi:MAG: DUF1214 domain-containing protein [Actinobacteria bacterium]|nr:DUF1214 domain-containing protein [Actinomycetota bacterium]
MHLFDYNLDHLGIGAIDSSEWKIADRQRAQVIRAIAAWVGPRGNHGYETTYAVTYVDAEGEQLNGAHRYEMRLETDPPVDALWSLNMYNMPEFHLVENSHQPLLHREPHPGPEDRCARLFDHPRCRRIRRALMRRRTVYHAWRRLHAGNARVPATPEYPEKRICPSTHKKGGVSGTWAKP